MDWVGNWIWTNCAVPERNAFVRFRRVFHWDGGAATMHITADSRYVLYVNSNYIGQGPVRSWPAHWKYDTYDIAPYLNPGANVIAVLVNHYGEGNFQYIPAPAGLLIQLESADRCILATDAEWLSSPDPAFTSTVPRISLQEGFEEQYDARQADAWTELNYNAADWHSAVVVAKPGDPPHVALEPRDIAQLTLEPVQPKRVVGVDVVRSIPYRWHMEIKPYLHPTDKSSNRAVHHAYLYTQIWSDRPVTAALARTGAGKVNGKQIEHNELPLRAGWNEVLLDCRGYTHLQAKTFACDTTAELRFACRGALGGAPWAVLGPFALNERLQVQLYNATDDNTIVCPAHAAATAAAGDHIWNTGSLTPPDFAAPYFHEMRPEHLPADVFLQSYTDQVIVPMQSAAQPLASQVLTAQPTPDTATNNLQPHVEQLWALLSGNHEWTVVQPCASGDVRILLDFGKEVVGFHRFEVAGAAGTILDWHNFEFIQPDGRLNFAEGMNNSFRYILRDGRQTYQTYVRRGFQYSYLTIRNLTAPLRIRLVEVLFNTYPQQHKGSFACSNPQLNRIWQVGAHSLRCCSEDTYVDCPTYEQTHWVGDARNEALVDWVINGDPDLWYRCLEQTGQSLERSPITESEVPSAWQNILPAWSFLWMRACREYLLFTGDSERALRLLPFVRQNVAGICQHLNSAGLFEIRAWNMFDWANMDTPSRGVVAHQNCFAVQGLMECAELADWLGAAADAAKWRQTAGSIAEAINQHLWSDDRQAYADCLRDGKQSSVFSQQTQTAAYISGVATGQRAQLCRQHMSNPPADFVRSGSPFFAFFLLEALAREGRDDQFLAAILRDWGFMIDKGATTFWEMWTRILPGGRLTRSHCHGWSAAPTFFLSTYTLGVHPLAPGFAHTEIAPKPGGLTWCRGTVPTPQGIISVQWENLPEQPFTMRITAPESLRLHIKPPREPARTVLNGVEIP